MFITKQTGFSLIELVIALFLSAILVLGLSKTYSLIYQTQQTQTALTTLMTRAQQASHYLQQAIQQAGFMGCNTLRHHTLTINHLQGFAGNDQNLDLPDRSRVVPNSDVIALYYLESATNQLLINENKTLWLNATPKRHNHHDLWIADCANAEVIPPYHYWANQQQALQLSKPLKAEYLPGAQIGRLVRHIFYLGNTDRYDDDRNDIRSLWAYDSRLKRSVELVANIIKMTISYGVVHQGMIAYLNSQQILNWDAVNIVKITLTLRSDHKVNGQYLEKDWSIYVTLRQ